MFLINGSAIIILGVIIYLLVRGILLATKFRRYQKGHWFNEAKTFLFTLYILMVVSVTLFPLPIGFDRYDYLFRSINLVPLVSIMKEISQIGIAYGGDVQFMSMLILRNVGGNILLLMPLGFLAPFLWAKFKLFKNVLLLGLTVSVSIELLQLLETFIGGWGRITDIDDVLCNVLGAVLGHLIYVLVIKLTAKLPIKSITNA